MPDPIEAPYLHWDTPNPADRIFETNASRPAKDREDFLAELERRQEKQHNDDEEDKDTKEESKQDTYERSYTMKQVDNKSNKKPKEEDKNSPGQVIDYKA